MYAEFSFCLGIHKGAGPHLRQDLDREVPEVKLFPDTIRCDLPSLAREQAGTFVAIVSSNGFQEFV
jgi:hypothetical protein